jgi:hypothetical protein
MSTAMAAVKFKKTAGRCDSSQWCEGLHAVMSQMFTGLVQHLAHTALRASALPGAADACMHAKQMTESSAALVHKACMHAQTVWI